MVVVGVVVSVLAACPTGPDRAHVLEKAAELRGPADAPPWELAFSRAGGDVLLDASFEGQSWRRTLPGNASCASLEQAAAVMLLSLEHNLEVQMPAARAVRTPAPEPAPATAPTPDQGWRWTVGAGEGVLLDGTGTPWELSLMGDARHAGGVWGLHVNAHLERSEQRTVSAATASWLRGALCAGPEVSFSLSPVALGLFAQLAGGPVWIDGRSGIGAGHFSSWDVGARAGVVLAPEVKGGWRPWLELGALAWLHQQEVRFPTTGVTIVVPSLVFDVAVGGAWGP